MRCQDQEREDSSLITRKIYATMVAVAQNALLPRPHLDLLPLSFRAPKGIQVSICRRKKLNIALGESYQKAVRMQPSTTAMKRGIER